MTWNAAGKRETIMIRGDEWTALATIAAVGLAYVVMSLAYAAWRLWRQGRQNRRYESE